MRITRTTILRSYPPAGASSRPGNRAAGFRVGADMQIELTDAAAALLSKRGKTLVIDLIRPTG